MVGDREHDVRGATEHGVPCLGVLWGYGDEAELSAAGAAQLARAPAELVTLLSGEQPADAAAPTATGSPTVRRPTRVTRCR